MNRNKKEDKKEAAIQFVGGAGGRVRSEEALGSLKESLKLSGLLAHSRGGR